MSTIKYPGQENIISYTIIHVHINSTVADSRYRIGQNWILLHKLQYKIIKMTKL